MKPIVVLCSGGVDSTFMLGAGARLAPTHALFVDYGQPAAEQERTASRWAAQQVAAQWGEIRCSLPCAQLHIGVGASGPREVPARNLALVSIGVSYAAQVGAKSVWLGVTRDDWAHYPDCRPGFVETANAVVDMLGLGITVESPLLGLRRRAIKSLACGIGLSLDGCWSCYQPVSSGLACQTCAACLRR